MNDKSRADEAFEAILASVNDVPRQLQQMLDAVIALQEIMPMPADSWEQFKRDIEYTNEKHGFNLTV